MKDVHIPIKTLNANMSKVIFQDNKYVFREYGGYIFKMNVNEDIKYLSVEKQNQYYWYLAEAMYKNNLATVRVNNSSVSNWELAENNTPCAAKFITFSELKKPLKSKMIGYALSRIHVLPQPDNNSSNSSNLQYIESLPHVT